MIRTTCIVLSLIALASGLATAAIRQAPIMHGFELDPQTNAKLWDENRSKSRLPSQTPAMRLICRSGTNDKNRKKSRFQVYCDELANQCQTGGKAKDVSFDDPEANKKFFELVEYAVRNGKLGHHHLNVIWFTSTTGTDEQMAFAIGYREPVSVSGHKQRLRIVLTQIANQRGTTEKELIGQGFNVTCSRP